MATRKDSKILIKAKKKKPNSFLMREKGPKLDPASVVKEIW